jgi:hypothetical protein
MGIVTRPKEIAPFQIERGMAEVLLRWPKKASD